MPQFPMSFNFNGPFNLTGAPGQTYSLVADDYGNLTIVEGAGPDSVDLETDVTGVLPTANGGTGAANLNALATSGANSNITSLTGLSTPLSTAQGGTGAANLNALATSGANGNITSLTGLTTALSTAQGGTGSKLFSSGTATFLTAGSVAVADASITASSIVIISQNGSTPVEEYFSVAITPTTGFTIYSSNSSSAAVVNYMRVK